MEMTTEEVKDFLNAPDCLVVRLPLFRDNDIAAERAVGFVKALEESGADIDVIVFSKNALSHQKVSTAIKNTKAKMCERIIDGLHLDYLPYTDVIISMPDDEKNLELVKRLCMRYGVLDVNEILIRQQ